MIYSTLLKHPSLPEVQWLRNTTLSKKMMYHVANFVFLVACTQKKDMLLLLGAT
jgi:hypothetical protein